MKLLVVETKSRKSKSCTILTSILILHRYPGYVPSFHRGGVPPRSLQPTQRSVSLPDGGQNLDIQDNNYLGFLRPGVAAGPGPVIPQNFPSGVETKPLKDMLIEQKDGQNEGSGGKNDSSNDSGDSGDSNDEEEDNSTATCPTIVSSGRERRLSQGDRERRWVLLHQPLMRCGTIRTLHQTREAAWV
jgi:hypothetical protein